MTHADKPNREVDGRRRRLLAGGSVAAAGVWVAPSVLTLDRVAAATGTCGAASIQVDWTDYATNGPVPGSITANDGTVITITTSDPFGVGGPRNFTVRTQMYGGLTGFLATEMVGGNNGDYVEVTMDFSQPVQLCFLLLDVDRRSGRWEDTYTMNGSLSGVPVTLTAADMITGPANTVVANNTVRGILDSNTPTSSPDANVSVTYPSEIDRIVFRHSDVTSWTSGQIVGIHDLLWC